MTLSWRLSGLNPCMNSRVAKKSKSRVQELIGPDVPCYKGSRVTVVTFHCHRMIDLDLRSRATSQKKSPKSYESVWMWATVVTGWGLKAKIERVDLSWIAHAA